NHAAVGLNQGLPADALGEIRGGNGRSPCQPAIAGGAHQDLIEAEPVVPLQVAVAVEGTARPAVANDPVLVGTRGRGNRANRILPCDAVRRAAYGYGRTLQGGGKRKRGDHPDSVLRIVRHRRVAGGIVGSASLAQGQAGQEAVSPSGSTVCRS